MERARLNRAALEELVEAWQQAELPADLAAPLTRSLTRHQTLTAEFREIADNDAKTISRALTRSVAAGDISLKTALIEQAALHEARQAISATNPTPRLEALFRSSKEANFGMATAHLLHHRDELTDLLGDTLDHLTAEARKLLPSLGTATTAQQAVRAGGKVATGWRTLEALDDRRKALHQVRLRLIHHNIIDDDINAARAFRTPLFTLAENRVPVGIRGGNDAA